MKKTKRVKLFELADGAQVVVLREIDIDKQSIIKLKIYSEIEDKGFVAFEVPLVVDTFKKSEILFKNTQKLKDFAIGVYNNQMKLIDQDFKSI